jgi:hypothetical protein
MYTVAGPTTLTHINVPRTPRFILILIFTVTVTIIITSSSLLDPDTPRRSPHAPARGGFPESDPAVVACGGEDGARW